MVEVRADLNKIRVSVTPHTGNGIHHHHRLCYSHRWISTLTRSCGFPLREIPQMTGRGIAMSLKTHDYGQRPNVRASPGLCEGVPLGGRSQTLRIAQENTRETSTDTRLSIGLLLNSIRYLDRRSFYRISFMIHKQFPPLRPHRHCHCPLPQPSFHCPLPPSPFPSFLTSFFFPFFVFCSYIYLIGSLIPNRLSSSHVREARRDGSPTLLVRLCDCKFWVRITFQCNSGGSNLDRL